jgi:hypothetical protein
LSWSMMRVSGCGMSNAYRVLRGCYNGTKLSLAPLAGRGLG